MVFKLTTHGQIEDAYKTAIEVIRTVRTRLHNEGIQGGFVRRLNGFDLTQAPHPEHDVCGTLFFTNREA